ncbi:hypothetical protein M5689_011200 [Euphorbia peplus]|nr:hypothetical protein M5689_011200 [Euphorbia peplus]
MMISTGRPLGKLITYHMSSKEFKQAHLYSLRNCDELVELVKEHKEILAAENSFHRCIERRHKAQFAEWVCNRVEHMYKAGSIQEDLYYLVCGPLRTVRGYSGYIVNGFRGSNIMRTQSELVDNICLATAHFTVEREADVVKWVSKELENIKQQKQKKKRKKTSNSNSFIVDDHIVV